MFTAIICSALLSLATDVVHGKCVDTTDRAQLPDGFTVHKVIGTWNEANLQCTSEGAVLASPINAELLDAMRTVIGINNTQYFIGTKYTRYPGPFMSVEGVPLDSMTVAVMEMVDKLDPRDGSCLSMDRYNIRVVPCCTRLPFMCYKAKLEANETTAAVTEQEVTTKASEHDMPMLKTINEAVLDTVMLQEPDVTTEDMPTQNTKTVAVSTHNELKDVTTEESIHKETTQNMNIAVPVETVTYKSLKNANCSTDDIDYKYYESTGSCYKKHKNSKTWDAAQATCEAEGGHLLVIDDLEEAHAIKDFDLNDVYPYAFVGLQDYGSRGWMSVTGKRREEVYNSWYFGQPKDESMNCGVIYPDGVLDNLYCYVDKFFICEKEIKHSV